MSSSGDAVNTGCACCAGGRKSWCDFPPPNHPPLKCVVLRAQINPVRSECWQGSPRVIGLYKELDASP